jgi:hypothetical protein
LPARRIEFGTQENRKGEPKKKAVGTPGIV